MRSSQSLSGSVAAIILVSVAVSGCGTGVSGATPIMEIVGKRMGELPAQEPEASLAVYTLSSSIVGTDTAYPVSGISDNEWVILVACSSSGFFEDGAVRVGIVKWDETSADVVTQARQARYQHKIPECAEN